MGKKKIIIRTDGSYEIGSGHIIRCLGLAEELRRNDFEAVFITQRLEGHIINKIKDNNFEVVAFNPLNIKEDLNFVKRTVKKIKPVFIIIDNYNIAYRYEKSLFFNTGARILSIDGLFRRHFCHILVNPNIFATLPNYREKVEEGCKVLSGYKYFILRDNFLDAKREKPQKDNNFRILVTLGGADLNNFTLEVIKVLRNFEDTHLVIDVIVGPANKNTNLIKEFIEKHCKKNFNLYINPKEMPKIINRCNLCICSGGVTIGEILFFNKPIIGFTLAANQRKTIRLLSQRGSIFNPGRITASSKKLENLVRFIMDNKNSLKKIEKKSKNLLDGLGKKRIVENIRRHLEKN